MIGISASHALGWSSATSGAHRVARYTGCTNQGETITTWTASIIQDTQISVGIYATETTSASDDASSTGRIGALVALIVQGGNAVPGTAPIASVVQRRHVSHAIWCDRGGGA